MDISTAWPYEALSASINKRTDRLNVPVGEFPEVVGYDGSIENGCRPLSGLKFMVTMGGSIAPITGYAGYSGSVTLKDGFQVQLRVGDSAYVDGFLYRVSDANGVSRIFFKWRTPGAVSYVSDTPIKKIPTGAGGTDPRLDGLQPMDVVVAGQFCYIFIAGSRPIMFYFNNIAAAQANLVVVEETGPGPIPELSAASYTIASKDTNGTNETYKYSGTNSYGNLTGAANPGDNFLNLTEPTTVEQQTITIAGTPTGGSFKLRYKGATAVSIAYNAIAATVDGAIEGLSTIGVGTLTTTGGPGPGTPWVVEFTGFPQQDMDLLEVVENALTGGTNPDVLVVQSQPAHSAKVKLFPFSFFGATVPATVTNPLNGQTQFQLTGPGLYSPVNPLLPQNPVFEQFTVQKRLLGPTLTNVPDEAADSKHVRNLGPLDGNRRYGFVIQLWDQARTGRVSKVSNLIEMTPVGTGEEPFRSPSFELKQISGTDSGTGTASSSLYKVAAGHRCGFVGVEVIYDANKFDTMLVYRTVADNPKGALSLDAVYPLTNKFNTTNQRRSAGVDLPSPWKRAFFVTKTPESQIAQQPSFDSSAFLMDERMPPGGSAIYHEGTIFVGNIGPVDKDISGMGEVRWSSTTKQQLESYSPLAKYVLRFAGEEIMRFVHNGPNILGFSRQNIYLFRKEGIYIRGYHVAGGVGLLNARGACEVGSTTYALTPSGLYTITQDGGISAVRAVQSLLVKDWRTTLDRVHLAFDQYAKAVVLHNTSRRETALLWLETSRVTLLKDTVFDVCSDGPCPKDGQVAGNVRQRACFFQQLEPVGGGYQWRVFTLDTDRAKVVIFTGHPDNNQPMLATLEPSGCEGRQVVNSTFSSGTSLVIKSDGMGASATRLEGCRVYVARASDPNLVGRKATIKNATIGGGATQTLTLESSDAAQLYGLVAGDELFLSPVYCLALGWAVGVVTPEGTPYASLRDKFRERLISRISPVFGDVSGPPTLTTPGTTFSGGGAAYTPLARFAGVIYSGNDTSPAIRGYPVETDGTARRSILNGAAVLGAPINPTTGYKGANLFPGIETFVTNYDYQLLCFEVEGRVLETKRPDRALTAGETS